MMKKVAVVFETGINDITPAYKVETYKVRERLSLKDLDLYLTKPGIEIITITEDINLGNDIHFYTKTNTIVPVFKRY